VEDQRERRRRHGGPGDPEQCAADDQHLGRGGERRQYRHGSEGGCADQQQPPPADPIPERAHRDEGAGHHEPVHVDDPQQLRARRLQVLAQRGDGEVQHRQVHHVQQAGQREDGEADPLAPTGPLRRRGGHGCRSSGVVGISEV
jgi:hypothetical protein